MKPNYFVIGSAKCGTHSICTLLGQHPDVFMVEPKETYFFSVPGQWEKGFDWYESLFAAAGDKRMRGEGSPDYTLGAALPVNVPKRIFEYAPDAKLIYIVRHPVQRIESMWLELTWWSTERLTWWTDRGIKMEIMQAHPSINKALRLNQSVFVDTTNYWTEIDRYRKYFPDDQILVVFLEDLMADHSAVMRECFTFLGVDADVETDLALTIRNASERKRIPRKPYAMVRSLPGARSVLHKAAGLMPQTLRSAITKRLLRAPVSERPHLDQETQAWVSDLLRDDMYKFLEFSGRPRNFWDL